MPGVDQLVGGGPRLGEDPEPAKLIHELVLGHVLGDRFAANAVEAVASRDRVAHELVLGAPVGERDPRRVGLDLVELHVGDLEPHILAAVEQRRDQVLDDLLLPVDRDVPAGERGHVDVVVVSVVAEVDARVLDALAVQALGDAEVAQQVHGVLLDQPGPDSLLDVLAVARLQHDAVDALALQQQGKREPRRTGADDTNLCSHGRELYSGAATMITSSVRGPWTPLTRTISMSTVADGPEMNVSGRVGSSRASASGTELTICSVRTTQR